MSTSTEQIVGVVGLGYVGLPLAVAFGERFTTIGYDSSPARISECRSLHDSTGEVGEALLRAASKLKLTNEPSKLSTADVIVIAVPTPVDGARLPDFRPLVHACETVGPHLKRQAIVVFESTVYPGATEEICIPILERSSGMEWKEGFFVGYSPERVNPGDKTKTLRTITKVVAGDSEQTLNRLAQLYETVVDAGVYRASSIRVAEAAKVIENTQRDLNIALMNELAIIFHRMNLDTAEVLEAAGTKWNFLNFRPGLVGGHCIGVDPYYLTYAAQKAGYHPEVILAGRRTNDSMGTYVAEQTIKCLAKSCIQIRGATIAVLGLTFKENCPDLRNSKVADVIFELETYGARVITHDPRADREEALKEYGITLSDWDAIPIVDAIVIAVAHSEYVVMNPEALLGKLSKGGCVIDVKSVLDRSVVASLGFSHWRL